MFLSSPIHAASFGVTYTVSQILWSHYLCPELSNYLSINHCEGINQVFSVFAATTVTTITPLDNDFFPAAGGANILIE